MPELAEVEYSAGSGIPASAPGCSESHRIPKNGYFAEPRSRPWKRHRASRAICRTALKTIGVDWSEPPKNWLIRCRWQKRGLCPRDGTVLHHGTIAGRITAWDPVCQTI